MEQLTIRVSAETLSELERVASERNTSKSEVAREYLQRGSEYDALQTENERLRMRVQKLIDMHEQHDELVRYVEGERSHSEKVRQASLPTRLKWLLLGDK